MTADSGIACGTDRSDVELEGFDGTRLRGWLYLPPGANAASAAPGVVMSHGFSATREMGLDPFARAIRDAGIAVLLYDHRNTGDSAGAPRRTINPWAQMRDMRRALGWLGERAEVDARRLGLWGSSFSGAQVLILGACDPRVRAVVANVPFAGFADRDYDDERVGGEAAFAALRDAVLDEGPDALSVRAEVEVGPLAVVAEPDSDRPAYLPQPESARWFLAQGARPEVGWRNEVTVVNAFGTDPAFDPGICAARCRPPLLMVVAEDDRVADVRAALAAWERAPEPKQLVRIPGDHFVPYEGEALERAAGAARDFFSRWL